MRPVNSVSHLTWVPTEESAATILSSSSHIGAGVVEAEDPDITLMGSGTHAVAQANGTQYVDYVYDENLENDFIVDELDLTEDGGASLVDYLEIPGMIANHMAFQEEPMTAHIASTEYEHLDQEGQADNIGIEYGIQEVSVSFAHAAAHLPMSIQSSIQTLGQPAPPEIYQQLPPHHEEEDDDDEEEDDEGEDVGDATTTFQGEHPVALTNPNPSTLNPGNYYLEQFLQHWAWQSRCLQGVARERGHYPWIRQVQEQLASQPPQVQYEDLAGDKCDIQGINWQDLGVSRREARERRHLTYKNYVNKEGSDRWHPKLPDIMLPQCENYFRFRRMQLRRSVYLAHFQLRSILACTSRSRAFYAGNGVVHQINPISGAGQLGLTFGDLAGVQVSTLAANHGFLVAGGFNGEYSLRNLDSEYVDERLECHDGIITTNSSGITNHVQIHLRRSSTAPQATFASNDLFLRTLDLATETFVSETSYNFPLNCSALSPDGRLRVVVGDDERALIVSAESERNTGGLPDIQHVLSGHRDYGFSCDWSDDGYTVATGFQDQAVKIWDARKWCSSSGISTPVCTLRTELAGVRNLKFSPLGSGKKVLVAAEEADFVNIIDAQTFKTKQTVDIFGEVGGVSFANDGQDLYVLCCDRNRGGLIQLERCGPSANVCWEEVRPVPHNPWFDPINARRAREAEMPRKYRHAEARRQHAAAVQNLELF